MKKRYLELKEISALDITDFCARIAETYDEDATLIDGGVFASLAKRLIAAEVQPGGPYNDETGRPTIQLNATIGWLFLLMGRPLPNVDTYLKKAASHPSTSDYEALERYRAAGHNIAQKVSSRAKRHNSYRRAAKTLRKLEEPARTQALQFLARIEAADTTHEIAAISQFTAGALRGIRISPTKLDVLGEANVHSWIAYSIYDHILDKEADASLLPAANICMRLALAHYKYVLPVRHPMQATIARYFDEVDVTSAWEMGTCRFTVTGDSIAIQTIPDYQQYAILASRSCIHILGPMIVASFSPPLPTDTIEHLSAGLRHYLVARQLSDDIHDWREDLNAGRISAVVALLLKRQNVAEHTTYNLSALVPALQKDFLDSGVLQICELILHHTHRALQELTSIECAPASDLISLVRRLERMANESIEYQRRFSNFTATYTSTLQS